MRESQLELGARRTICSPAAICKSLRVPPDLHSERSAVDYC
jgi:hypothetical protein